MSANDNDATQRPVRPEFRLIPVDCNMVCLDVGDDEECTEYAAYTVIRRNDPAKLPVLALCQRHARFAVDSGFAEQPED